MVRWDEVTAEPGERGRASTCVFPALHKGALQYSIAAVRSGTSRCKNVAVWNGIKDPKESKTTSAELGSVRRQVRLDAELKRFGDCGAALGK